MATTQPIRSKSDIIKLKSYFLEKNKYRNYCLVSLGLNTALRISDILKLKWYNVYDFSRERYWNYIYLTEDKTRKDAQIRLNDSVIEALDYYKASKKKITPIDSIICSNRSRYRPISRTQAYRIIKQAVDALNLEGNISCHSLRKTFGYQAWRAGAEPVLLMNIFNHSSYQITKRYLGIEQEDKDEIFLKLNL